MTRSPDGVDVFIFAAGLIVVLGLSVYGLERKNNKLDHRAAQIDSLMQVEDSLRREVQRLHREKRELRDALNGQVEIMGQAITTETKRPHEMQAVAHVIKNRMESSRFPALPSAVVTEPGAFSGMPTDRPPLDTATVIARRALLERSRDPTSGATYFFSPVSMVPKWSAPRWAYHYREQHVPQIADGRFKFYQHSD